MAFPGCRPCLARGEETAAAADRFSNFDSVVGGGAAPLALAAADDGGGDLPATPPRCATCAKLAPFIPFLLLIVIILASAFGGDTDNSVPRLRPVPSSGRRQFCHCAKCGQGKKKDGPCKRCGCLENG